ncbi:MAG: hypothetical protein HYZ07_02635 [Candidatus Harrisonbacteria bacterium]|nr:hypothetical protein [Candidatus Harrisonbacteria bacterium]MBI2604113.1 hypothetical protein [Candidatus Harrisonbacteria bacterium]MBI3114834.1 hypothetical protein [Candidatus Harrisonbacteria bacterium]
MKHLSDLMRVAAALTALYTFYIGHTGDALIVLAITIGTLGFKLRRHLLLRESREADRWEFALTFLFTANTIFVALGLFYSPSFTFFDTLMHFSGGAVVGWWAYLALTHDRTLALDPIRTLLFIAGAAALFGVGWELFEWALDNTVGVWYIAQKAQPSLNDTMKDLALDVIGGLIAGAVLLRSRGKN